MKNGIVKIMLLALCLSTLGVKLPRPPRECAANYNFSALDPATIKSLSDQGSLVVVRQRPDNSLVNVTAGQVINAPVDVVQAVILDFPSYPKFLPQTDSIKVIGREGDLTLVEQTLAIKVWQLPSVDITYQLAYRSEPNRIRFWWVSGSMPGTYGGWDLVPSGKQTLMFYTLYSNLTSLGWGLGSALKTQPDFFAGINVTTAMLTARATKQEAERRAKK